jgi:hypothetical protein
MSSCEFKEIIAFVDFEVENGMLGLDRDCYLSIVKFLDSSILRKDICACIKSTFPLTNIFKVIFGHV